MASYGKYVVKELVGEGGFGTVYRGWHPTLKRDVAIKTCHFNDEHLRERFALEAEISALLDHRNIVRVYDYDEEDGEPYLVQEFLEGEDLNVLIRRGEPRGLEMKIAVLRQIAEGLKYAHDNGVVHRDIKPSNIRVSPDNKIKILDFGIAKLMAREQQFTRTGVQMGGTDAYLSPEHLSGVELDHRTDMFSYGVLAYEVMSGQRPFGGDTIAVLYNQIVNVRPSSIIELQPECPQALSDVIERCLEKRRDDRFADLGEVVARLSELEGGGAIRWDTPVREGTPVPTTGILGWASQKIRDLQEKQDQREEERRRRVEEKRDQEEEEARQKLAEIERERREDTTNRRRQEEERRRMIELEAQRRQEEERRRQAEVQAQRKAAEAQRQREELAAEQRKEEELRRRAAIEAQREAEEEARTRQVEIDAQKRAEEEESRRLAEIEAREKAEEEAARRRVEQEAKRKAEEAQGAREAEERLKREEIEAKERAATEERQKLADDEARRQAVENEKLEQAAREERAKEEEEKRRQAAALEVQRKAAEEERQAELAAERQAAEQERQGKAQIAARQKAAKDEKAERSRLAAQRSEEQARRREAGEAERRRRASADERAAQEAEERRQEASAAKKRTSSKTRVYPGANEPAALKSSREAPPEPNRRKWLVAAGIAAVAVAGTIGVVAFGGGGSGNEVPDFFTVEIGGPLPPDAQVLVDGARRDVAPTTDGTRYVQLATTGPHTIAIAVEGHEPMERTVDYSSAAADTARWQPILIPVGPTPVDSARLVIADLPSGTTIRIDDVVAGASVTLEPGEHTIALSAADYTFSEPQQQITLEAGESETLTPAWSERAPPPPSEGTVVIAGNVPPGTTILVDGRERSGGSLNLSEGQYRLEARAPNHDPFEETVNVRGGQSITWPPNALTPHDGTIRVTGLPAAGTVTIASAAGGTTQTVDRDRASGISLPPGTYQLGANAPDYEPANTRVTLDAGGDESWNADLQPAAGSAPVDHVPAILGVVSDYVQAVQDQSESQIRQLWPTADQRTVDQWTGPALTIRSVTHTASDPTISGNAATVRFTMTVTVRQASSATQTLPPLSYEGRLELAGDTWRFVSITGL